MPDQWKEVRRHDHGLSLSRHLRVRADVPTHSRLSLRLLSGDPSQQVTAPPPGVKDGHAALCMDLRP